MLAEVENERARMRPPSDVTLPTENLDGETKYPMRQQNHFLSSFIVVNTVRMVEMSVLFVPTMTVLRNHF